MNRLFPFVVLLCAATAAAQGIEPGVVGTWVAPMMGFNMVFKINADGSCVFDDEPGKCSAKGGTLVWTGAEGTERYKYTLSGGTLTISGGDMEMAVAFQKQGGAKTGGKAQPVAQEQQQQQAQTPVAEEKAAPAGKGPSSTFSKDIWGVKFTGPAGWKFVEKDGSVLGGHDSEAGLMIIRYEYKTTREKILADYQNGINEGGVSATPTGEAKDWKGGSVSGLAGELEGTMNNGQVPIKLRSIALLNNYGGALVVAGLTTPDKYPTLKARVEQLAANVTMSKPKEVPGGGLAGAYAFIYVSKMGSYSREAYLTLCRSGRFTRRGEMIGSAELSGGARGNAFAGSNNAGTWKAMGDANSGTLILNFGDGSTGQVNYKASHNPKDRSAYGAAIYFGNDLYQKTGAGDC